MQNGQNEHDAGDLYPEALIKWAGHREGGVRLPFNDNSGRPTGSQIRTPLVHRLSSWAKEIVAGSGPPRVLLLVGGPGNGKTDAVEGCLHALDRSLGSECGLIEKFVEAFHVSGKSIPPRKVSISTETLNVDNSQVPFSSINLVQDATEGDPSRGISAEELLLEDLHGAINENKKDLYLCCVNRGILARAAHTATVESKYHSLVSLINCITESVTSKPDAPNCWPLQGHEDVAVWPMDVESLVVSGVSNDGNTVAHEILATLVEESRWKKQCDLGSRCPFCQNRKLLVRKSSQDNLIRILHYYELQSGKRWSFRDLFSLIAYLLVGDHTELEIRGRRVSPCAWAEAQYKLSKDPSKNTAEKDRATFLLASRLYHHRLFPNWPAFNTGEYRKAKQELFDDSADSGLRAARSFFRFLSSAGSLSTRASGDVRDRVRESLAPRLDPAVSHGEAVLLSKNGQEYSISDVEGLFSISVEEGFQVVASQLEPLERDLLAQLVSADNSLTEDKFPRRKAKQARLLQAVVRQFSARFVKRSLGVRTGRCLNYRQLERYASALNDDGVVKEARRELRKLLHDENGHFKAYLATTFGQPVAERSRNVALLLNKSISIKPSVRGVSTSRPADPLPYLLIEGHYVGLTFDLYKSLDDVFNGLSSASLPSDIYALLDRIKSLVSGRVVRDEEVLNDDPVIIVGDSGLEIEFIGGEFSVSKGWDH